MRWKVLGQECSEVEERQFMEVIQGGIFIENTGWDLTLEGSCGDVL